MGSPKSIEEFGRLSEECLSPTARCYFSGTADQGQTYDRNLQAFLELALVPQLMSCDVSSPKMDRTLLGDTHIDFPVGVSPTAFHRWAHPLGEAETAIGAKKAGTVMTLSAWTGTAPEKVAEAGGNLWQNIYVFKDRSVTLEMVKRAERAGFKAIVVTCDASTLGKIRESDRRIPYLKRDMLPIDPVLVPDPTWGWGSGNESTYCWNDPSLTWAGLDDIVRSTSLPIIAKGVMSDVCASTAINHGVKGIWVSNHGGRQLDGLPATLDVLPEILKAVGGRGEVYLDGGIRSGNDAFKALSLGAKAVFLGRPILWGLAHSGQEGVQKVLEIVKNELSITMSLAGCADIDRLESSFVRRFPSRI